MNENKAKHIDQLLESLYVYIKQKIASDQAGQVVLFAMHYFKYVALEDIKDYAIEDLFGALLSHWNLLLKRGRGSFKIDVYNPSLEVKGWQSQHSIVEIVVEDMPFLIQSIAMEINRQGFTNHLLIHPVFSIQRDTEGSLISLAEGSIGSDHKECLIHVEINRQSDQQTMQKLKDGLSQVLREVAAATQDWKICRDKMQENIETLKNQIPKDQTPELKQQIHFLEWLSNNHFVFLGYGEFRILSEEGKTGLAYNIGSGVGILRDDLKPTSHYNFTILSKETLQKLNDDTSLIITKSIQKSKVHRPAFMDYIAIKQFNDQHEMIGEHRFLGLYSSSAYSCNVNEIPMVNQKIQRIRQKSVFQRDSHDDKALLFVLNSLPRDELFQADENSLFTCAMGVMRLRERQRVRVFVRHEFYGHFVSVLVFAPRDRYHTESRKKIQSILLDAFKGENVDFSVQLSESALARIHFIIHSIEGCCIDHDTHQIEQKIITALSDWNDDFQRELVHYFGEAQGNNFFEAYKQGFSAAYREDFSARTALLDLNTLRQLESKPDRPQCVLYSPLTASGEKKLRFKIYCSGAHASLSMSLPMLENMGVRVSDEKPYEIKKAGIGFSFWMHDFGLDYHKTHDLNLEQLKPRFQVAFQKCWQRHVENDGFNRLIIETSLGWREVNVFRALYFFLRQIGIAFSQSYVESTLANNPIVTELLANLFLARFDPRQNNRGQISQAYQEQIEHAIDQVKSLDEDRILRRYLNLILATIRTNYFKISNQSSITDYLSFKFDSKLIDGVPEPVPFAEIFVYSPRMEGVHLRGGLVARGGLRWSDRREDYRTEILGLMKAQMTKNAVIVPTGAKGGFIVKYSPEESPESSWSDEVVACYQLFIRGLLDLTDNFELKADETDKHLVKYDSLDPYLVVAADKGTASFSDYANALSETYQFWMGDAFASGGSSGYDHKAMGITARGAWESVKHHFSSMNIDISTHIITVVGIGGMAGDVFGNGMLLSKKIKLLAAFDHECIFLDPDPDPETSFKERKRLFKMPKASWRDYQQNHITKGGGVFLRSAKAVLVSDPVKRMLNIEQEQLTPNELIKSILTAPVDLLWNGGIGTFVKGSHESHMDVGDRTNDSVRIDADQLHCKVIGEGGNLGLTQTARIEYAQLGGILNTDSIDNSAGVDCSDHEVNIKIVLDTLIRKGDLTQKQRNLLLDQMTDQVAHLVLQDNIQQNRAISMIAKQSLAEPGMVQRLINILEQRGGLNRTLEKIPDQETLLQRAGSGQGLTRPEIAVLLAYGKQMLKNDLISANEFPNASIMKSNLPLYFPEILREKFPEAIKQHRLSGEILANLLINELINRLGLNFPFRLIDEKGYSSCDIIISYRSVCRILDLDVSMDALDALEGKIDTEALVYNRQVVVKAIERSMSWFLRRDISIMSKDEAIRIYQQGIKQLIKSLYTILTEQQRHSIDLIVEQLIEQGIPADLALNIASLDVKFVCLDVVDIHQRTDCSLDDAAKAFFSIISILELSWVRDQILALPKDDVWESSARRSLREQLNTNCCLLAIDLLQTADTENTIAEKIEHWQANKQEPINRYRSLLQRISAEKKIDFGKLTVLLNELRNFLGNVF